MSQQHKDDEVDTTQQTPKLPPLTPQDFASSFAQFPGQRPAPPQLATTAPQQHKFDHVVLPQIDGPTPDRPNRVGVDNRARDYFAQVLNQTPEEAEKYMEAQRELEKHDTIMNLQRCSYMGLSLTAFGAIKDVIKFTIHKRRPGRLPIELQRLKTYQYLKVCLPFHSSRALLTTLALFGVSEGAYQWTGENMWTDPAYHTAMWGLGALGFTIVRPREASKFYTPLWTLLFTFMGANYWAFCHTIGKDPLSPSFQGKRRVDPYNALRLQKIERDTGIAFDVLSAQVRAVKEEEDKVKNPNKAKLMDDVAAV